jgi:hypothetical protein
VRIKLDSHYFSFFSYFQLPTAGSEAKQPEYLIIKMAISRRRSAALFWVKRQAPLRKGYRAGLPRNDKLTASLTQQGL